MILIQLFILFPFLALIVWFWVLVFKLLIRANKALKLYIEKETKKF